LSTVLTAARLTFYAVSVVINTIALLFVATVEYKRKNCSLWVCWRQLVSRQNNNKNISCCSERGARTYLFTVSNRSLLWCLFVFMQ